MQTTAPEAAAAGVVAITLPFAGQTTSIIIVALFGAAVAMSRGKQGSLLDSAKMMFRAVAFSVFFTMLAVKVASTYLPVESGDLVIPIAFLIAFVGDDWFRLKEWALRWVTRKKEGES